MPDAGKGSPRVSVDSTPRSESPLGSYFNPPLPFQFILVFLLWDPQDGERLIPQKKAPCQLFSLCLPPYSQPPGSKQTLSYGEVTVLSL